MEINDYLNNKKANPDFLNAVYQVCGHDASNRHHMDILVANGFTNVSQFAGYTVDNFSAMQYVHTSTNGNRQYIYRLGYRYALLLANAFGVKSTNTSTDNCNYEVTIHDAPTDLLVVGRNHPGWWRRRHCFVK